MSSEQARTAAENLLRQSVENAIQVFRDSCPAQPDGYLPVPDDLALSIEQLRAHLEDRVRNVKAMKMDARLEEDRLQTLVAMIALLQLQRL